MDDLARWAHPYRSDPLANADEVVQIKRNSQWVPAFVLPVLGAANIHLEPLTAGDLVESGWVRLGTDDVALLRIMRALEAIVAQNATRTDAEPSAMTPEATQIVQEVMEIQTRRARTP